MALAMYFGYDQTIAISDSLHLGDLGIDGKSLFFRLLATFSSV
jgi:hypothetical protein